MWQNKNQFLGETRRAKGAAQCATSESSLGGARLTLTRDYGDLSPMITQVTQNIEIEVCPAYVPEESDPSQNHYFFAYTVRIRNLGLLPAQLVSRHWIITNGLGTTEEVRGAGVVGLQPVILPGQAFEYSSFCPLPTPTGTMKGSYQMVIDDGASIDVEIPQFYLVEPNSYP